MDSKPIKDEPGLVKHEIDDSHQNVNSPLGTLDPSRLTDMVVDHHIPQFQQQQQHVQQHWQPPESPSHNQMRPHHLHDGTITPQPGSVTPQMMQQQGMCMPGQSPMNSPMSGNPNLQMGVGGGYDHQNQPGFNHHIQGQYPQGQNPVLPPQSPGGIQMQQQMQSPNAQSAMYQQRMMQMQQSGQGGYPNYPQNTQQWAGHQGGGYVQNPRVMGGPPGPGMVPQRVPLQRVPYPNSGGYPPGAPGMAQQQAYVGAQGVQVQRPQQLPQRAPQYPSGVAGGAPTGYGYPAQPPQGYNQQMAAYQRAPQVAQPMRPYMNSPQAMVNPNAYPPGQQPQTPQTPQPQYTPNGSRFPQPTPSPHYGAPGPDIRSPPLMSPNQTPMVRNLSNGDISAPPQMRIPQMQYFAHDPHIPHIPPEMCLVGCTIHVLDNEKYNIDKSDMQNMANTVKLLGGDIIEFSIKNFNVRQSPFTHLIVDCSRNQYAIEAAKCGKRVVTMQWLYDTVQNKKMLVPWRLAHLPGPNIDVQRIHAGKVISLSGFDAEERVALKFMIENIGARVTPYLSSYNNLMIAKSEGCEKVGKAREWRIPVVNYQWLADAYVQKNFPIDSPQYALGSQCMGVNCAPYQLEMHHEMYKLFLAPWRQCITVGVVQWNRALEVKQVLGNEDSVFPNARLRASGPAPTEDVIAKMATLRTEVEKKKKRKSLQFRFCLAGMDEDVTQMMGAKIRFLGGIVIEDPSKCTHCVVLNGRRNLRMLMALSCGAFIVRADFILKSYDIGQWHDSLDYMIKDEDAERAMCYNMKLSVLSARHKKVFEGLQFYLTPSLDPPRDSLARLVEVAGGKVDRERPDPKYIAKCVETDVPYIVIGNEADLRLVHYLVECNFPIYTTEFVLMSVLRQHVDPIKEYRVNVDALFPPRTPIQAQPPAQHPPGPGPAQPVPPAGFMQRAPATMQSQIPPMGIRPQGQPMPANRA